MLYPLELRRPSWAAHHYSRKNLPALVCSSHQIDASKERLLLVLNRLPSGHTSLCAAIFPLARGVFECPDRKGCECFPVIEIPLRNTQLINCLSNLKSDKPVGRSAPVLQGPTDSAEIRVCYDAIGSCVETAPTGQGILLAFCLRSGASHVSGLFARRS